MGSGFQPTFERSTSGRRDPGKLQLSQYWFSFKRRRDIERTNLECHRETTTIRGSQKLAWSDLKRGNNRLQSRARSKDYDVGTSLQSEDELVSESERGRESDANEPEPSGCKCGLTAALTRSANSTTSRTSRGHSEDSDAPRGFWSAFRWRRPSKTSTRKTGRSRKKRLATVVGRTEVLSVSKLARVVGVYPKEDAEKQEPLPPSDGADVPGVPAQARTRLDAAVVAKTVRFSAPFEREANQILASMTTKSSMMESVEFVPLSEEGGQPFLKRNESSEVSDGNSPRSEEADVVMDRRKRFERVSSSFIRRSSKDSVEAMNSSRLHRKPSRLRQLSGNSGTSKDGAESSGVSDTGEATDKQSSDSPPHSESAGEKETAKPPPVSNLE